MKKFAVVLVASSVLLAACGTDQKEDKKEEKETSQTTNGSHTTNQEDTNQENDNNQEGEEEEMNSQFVKFEGKVKEVNTAEALEDNKIVVNDTTNQDEELHIQIHKKTKFYNSNGEEINIEAIKPESTITVYMDSSRPVPMIYPPRYIVDVVIVDDGEVNFADVAKFDDKLVSDTNSVKLIENEDTIIVDDEGNEKTWEDVKNANAIVFYTASTRSIPAQTSPSKVVITKVTELEATE